MGAMSGSSWLVRLTHKVMRCGVALGDEAMVNSRGFCRGQCSKKSSGSMVFTPSIAQNSCILQHNLAPCNTFSASTSASSLATQSRAACSLNFGCRAVSIFFVGARVKSQYFDKASPNVHGVGNGRLMVVPCALPAGGTNVIHLLRSAGVKPINCTAASTSAGSFSGNKLKVPPVLYSLRLPVASNSTSTVARPASGFGFCLSSRTFATLVFSASK
mmetsp:Transcript_9453/g.27317  ORF Transcript_9453/g.27317 Transcript_9453/m.27317 type:complete len:216 (+) Transcript_9453:1006-1653(+)